MKRRFSLSAVRTRGVVVVSVLKKLRMIFASFSHPPGLEGWTPSEVMSWQVQIKPSLRPRRPFDHS